MDRFTDRVPIRTIERGSRYDGKVYFEKLSSIRAVNGQPVTNLEKSALKHGDSVSYVYRNKTFAGFIETSETALPVMEGEELLDSPEKRQKQSDSTAKQPHVPENQQLEESDSTTKRPQEKQQSSTAKRPPSLSLSSSPPKAKKMKGVAGRPKTASKTPGEQT